MSQCFQVLEIFLPLKPNPQEMSFNPVYIQTLPICLVQFSKQMQYRRQNQWILMQVAYLASSLFLDSNSNLIVLVVNTMLQDLRSENYLTGK